MQTEIKTVGWGCSSKREKFCVQLPALYVSGVVVHAYNPSTWKGRENQKFMVVLGYISSWPGLPETVYKNRQ